MTEWESNGVAPFLVSTVANIDALFVVHLTIFPAGKVAIRRILALMLYE